MQGRCWRDDKPEQTMKRNRQEWGIIGNIFSHQVLFPDSCPKVARGHHEKWKRRQVVGPLYLFPSWILVLSIPSPFSQSLILARFLNSSLTLLHLAFPLHLYFSSSLITAHLCTSLCILPPCLSSHFSLGFSSLFLALSFVPALVLTLSPPLPPLRE